jgi:hypothetical protein
MTALTDYYQGVADNIPTVYTMDTNAVYRAINRARRRVARQTDATLMVTTPAVFTVGQESYVYPTVSGCIMKFILETYYYLGNMRVPDRGSLPRIRPGAEMLLNFNGWPLGYYLLNEHIYYWPTPSFAYTYFVKGKLEPIDLTIAVPTEVIIPEPYQDAVIFAAARYTALLDANIELAKAMEQLYQIELGQLPRNFM